MYCRGEPPNSPYQTETHSGNWWCDLRSLDYSPDVTQSRELKAPAWFDPLDYTLLQSANPDSIFTPHCRRRLIYLLAYQFRDLTSVTALGLMNNVNPSDTDALAASGQATAAPSNQPLVNNRAELFRELTPFDLKHRESYSNNLLDYHVVMDLLSALVGLYFNHRIIDLSAKQDGDTEEYPSLTLSAIPNRILLAIGLQCKSVSDLEKELNLPSNQIMGMLIKVIKKCYTSFRLVQSQVTIAAPPSLLAPPAPAGSALDNDQSENGDIEPTGAPATSLKRRELPASANWLINPDTIAAENDEWAPVNLSLDDDDGWEGQWVIRKQQRAETQSQIAKGSSSSSVVSIVSPLGTSAKRKATTGPSAPSHDASQDAKRTHGGPMRRLPPPIDWLRNTPTACSADGQLAFLT
ncbi:N-acetyltransferase 10 [Dimargaris cristalligena]|uniref:tRNA binding domain-containing protein n=1 Tax=Dimargaris cristalligena TaxID=215637 RepID=A0A4P9ZLJ6_9FUNG|nr:N-acetyltransferase 10 [Dimargaris cristalligena]RKP34186.1 tRNA binding domain-containing protein [Dimargaris cristalligena]|eukprot:RKP34186.1 tRNA binding domain-containing protein [Dimargaris cristalligena]